MKTHIVQQTEHQLRHNIIQHVKFQNTGKNMGSSIMRQNYMLKKTTTRTEKIEKSRKSSKCIIL